MPLLGDYNFDGTVDVADYVVWRKNLIAIPNGYNTWHVNFGATLGSGSTLTPAQRPLPASAEPGSALLF